MAYGVLVAKRIPLSASAYTAIRKKFPVGKMKNMKGLKLVWDMYMSLYVFCLGQIISTVLGKLTMAVKTVTLPEPESGTKRRKPTTPKNDAFAMPLSAEPLKLGLFLTPYMVWRWCY